MRRIYVDANNRCYPWDTGGLTAVETDFFDGKCDEFILGYCCDPGLRAIHPRMPLDRLEAAQREYEQQTIADMRRALQTLGVNADE